MYHYGFAVLAYPDQMHGGIIGNKKTKRPIAVAKQMISLLHF
jgi:hypothetical protein